MRRDASYVFLGNVVSKGFGFAREILTAALFGTGAIVAAFRIGLSGTLIPINFLTSDALNSVYVPLHKQVSAHSEENVSLFVWTIGGAVLLVALTIGAVLWWTAPTWVHILAPGVSQSVITVACSVLRIMSIGVPLYLLSAFLIFVGMANDDFIPISVRATIQNVGLISGICSAFLFSKPSLFAWGFTSSYLVFFGWALQREARAGFLKFPSQFDSCSVRQILTRFWRTLRPLLLLPFFLQGIIVVERMIASLISVSAISALDYARFVTESMITLIAVPVSYAGLTHWSGLSLSGMRQQLQKVILFVLIIGIPISTFFLSNASLAVNAMYARGAFNGASVRITSSILSGISYGLWAQVLGYILIKGLNAQRENRKVLIIMISSLCANVLFDVLLYRKFGASTLGLGNSVYGAGLLIGSLTALGLWRDFLQSATMLLVGGGVYVGVMTVSRVRTHFLWEQIAEVLLVTIAFWAGWIFSQKRLRRFVCGTIFRRD